jgi:hypothetical protein
MTVALFLLGCVALGAFVLTGRFLLLIVISYESKEALEGASVVGGVSLVGYSYARLVRASFVIRCSM